MSVKSMKTGKDVGDVEFKKDLSDGAALLTALASKIQHISTAIHQSHEALASDRRLKAQISSLERQLMEAEESDRTNTERFAQSTLQLTAYFNDGLKKAEAQFKQRLQEEIKKYEGQTNDVRRQMASDQTQLKGLRARENSTRSDADAKVQRAEKEWAAKEALLEQQLQEARKRLSDTQERERLLSQELHEQHIILQGRETEKQQLNKKLKDIEAFNSLSLDQIRSGITAIEQDLHEACRQCVESADLLPSWNRLPHTLRKAQLPNSYDKETVEGLAFVINVLRDSIVRMLRKSVLTDAIACACPQAKKISTAMYQQSASRHAAWRSLIVRTVGGNNALRDELYRELDRAAADLLHSWQLFPGGVDQQTQDALSQFLRKTYDFWLRLQMLPARVLADYRAGSALVDDTGEAFKAVRMPGDFGAQEVVEPVLCLFPSFWYIPIEKGTQPILIHQGIAMYKDSPELLTIVEAEQKKRTSQSGSQRSPVVQKVQAHKVNNEATARGTQ